MELWLARNIIRTSGSFCHFLGVLLLWIFWPSIVHFLFNPNISKNLNGEPGNCTFYSLQMSQLIKNEYNMIHLGSPIVSLIAESGRQLQVYVFQIPTHQWSQVIVLNNFTQSHESAVTGANWLQNSLGFSSCLSSFQGYYAKPRAPSAVEVIQYHLPKNLG